MLVQYIMISPMTNYSGFSQQKMKVGVWRVCNNTCGTASMSCITDKLAANVTQGTVCTDSVSSSCVSHPDRPRYKCHPCHTHGSCMIGWIIVCGIYRSATSAREQVQKDERREIMHGKHVLDEPIVQVITASHSPSAFRLKTATQKESGSHQGSNCTHSVLYALIK